QETSTHPPTLCPGQPPPAPSSRSAATRGGARRATRGSAGDEKTLVAPLPRPPPAFAGRPGREPGGRVGKSGAVVLDHPLPLVERRTRRRYRFTYSVRGGSARHGMRGDKRDGVEGVAEGVFVDLELVTKQVARRLVQKREVD